jgi:hypothetical protein
MSFLAHFAKGNVSFCHHLSSVNFSHFNLLLWNPSTKWSETVFRNQPIRNKNCLWQPCLLTNRDKMSNLYREPSIDASYQVSVHLAKRLQRRRFFKSANQKQELPVFSSPCQRQCELLPSLGVRCLSSVNFSHFNLLLWNPSAKWS